MYYISYIIYYIFYISYILYILYILYIWVRGEGVPHSHSEAGGARLHYRHLQIHSFPYGISIFLIHCFCIFWKSLFTANCNRKIVATFANCNVSRRFSLASSMYTSVGRLVFFLNEKNQFAKITILTLIATQKCEQRNQWIPRWVVSACFGSQKLNLQRSLFWR